MQAAKRARFIEAAERAHDALLQRNPADFRGLLADTRRGHADRARRDSQRTLASRWKRTVSHCVYM